LIYSADAAQGGDAGGGFASWRAKGKSEVNDIDTTRAHSADVYFLPTTHTTFYDMDNYGFEDRVFFLWQSFPSAKTSSRESSEIGNLPQSPVSIMGYGCPNAERHHSCLVIESNTRWLLKWDFTNT
jgi:hypothetical protein